MKRRLLKLAVFLLLGAIVNVAVAWGIALLVNPLKGAEFREAAKYESGVSSYTLDGYCKPGVQYWDGSYWESPEIKDYWTPNENVEALVPSWGRLGRSSIPFFHRVIIGYGWPVISVWGELSARTDEYERKYHGVIRWRDKEWLGAYQGDWSWEVPSVKVPATLPFLPAWPGFAFNTLFYAVILWVLFAAPFALCRWRRVRRGQCPACGYPVGEAQSARNAVLHFRLCARPTP